MSRLVYVEFSGQITLEGVRYNSPDLLPHIGSYVRAHVEQPGEALCFDMRDQFVCTAATPHRWTSLRTTRQRHAEQRLRALVWTASLIYGVAAWTCIGLTAFGQTDWTWTATLAPLWAPAVLLLIVMVAVDLYRSSQPPAARAMRRAWYRITRPLRRLA